MFGFENSIEFPKFGEGDLEYSYFVCFGSIT